MSLITNNSNTLDEIIYIKKIVMNRGIYENVFFTGTQDDLEEQIELDKFIIVYGLLDDGETTFVLNTNGIESIELDDELNCCDETCDCEECSTNKKDCGGDCKIIDISKYIATPIDCNSPDFKFDFDIKHEDLAGDLPPKAEKIKPANPEKSEAKSKSKWSDKQQKNIDYVIETVQTLFYIIGFKPDKTAAKYMEEYLAQAPLPMTTTSNREDLYNSFIDFLDKKPEMHKY